MNPETEVQEEANARVPFFARLAHVFKRRQPSATEPQPTQEEQPSPESPPATEPQPTSEEQPSPESPPATEPQPTSEEQPSPESPPATEPQPTSEEQPSPESPPSDEQKSPKSTPRTVLLHDDPKDIEKLAHTIASAFEDDPMVNYLQGPHAKHAYEKALIFNRTVLHSELSRAKGQTTIHVTDDNNCVAIWHNPGHWKITGVYFAKFMIALVRTFGWRAILMASSMREVEHSHPQEPHMHLFLMGTHKDHQGKGYGSTVILEMLKHCDMERLPAYLESSNQRNLSFYRRHGFELLQQIQGSRVGCPPLYTLWREPQPIQKK